MPNILINPNSGIIEFSTGIAGGSAFDAGITSGNRVARLNYDNLGGLNLTSYVNITGTAGTSGQDRFSIDGVNGRLFSVTDSLSGSLLSVNDIAGLPIFEVFDDNRIVAGQFNRNDFIITGNSVGIGGLPNTGNTKLYVSGNVTISGNLNALGNYYVKVARFSDQTVSQGSDAVIQFSGVADPNNWYNSGTYRTTPTVAGNYAINVSAIWRQGTISPTNQTNIQIRKGTNTIAFVQEPVNSGMNITQTAFAIASLNGSSDYIDVTAYTSNTTSQALIGDTNGAWTKMELFKLN